MNVISRESLRVGIIQSSYLPWRGYFDFISSVDIFIFHDDIQYTKGDWRNRNKIKADDSIKWLTMPVKKDKVKKIIADTYLVDEKLWKRKHLQIVAHYYRKAPYFFCIKEMMEEAININHETISALNIYYTKVICDFLEIKTKLINSVDIKVSGTKTEKIINILKEFGASIYLSGPTADNYLRKNLFLENNIKLEYKSYEYPKYPQLGKYFNDNLSIIDLLANCGHKSIEYLTSKKENLPII